MLLKGSLCEFVILSNTTNLCQKYLKLKCVCVCFFYTPCINRNISNIKLTYACLIVSHSTFVAYVGISLPFFAIQVNRKKWSNLQILKYRLRKQRKRSERCRRLGEHIIRFYLYFTDLFLFFLLSVIKTLCCEFVVKIIFLNLHINPFFRLSMLRQHFKVKEELSGQKRTPDTYMANILKVFFSFR